MSLLLLLDVSLIFSSNCFSHVDKYLMGSVEEPHNVNYVVMLRVPNRHRFSGCHDCQAKKFGCHCTKSGSRVIVSE